MFHRVKKKIFRSAKAIPIVVRHWREIICGFLLGTVVGFAYPTISNVVSKITSNVITLANRYPSTTVWPQRGMATLLVILVVAFLLYGIRAASFLRKFWTSWRATLVSGFGVIWFATSATSFSLFSVTGSGWSLLVMALGVGTTAMVVRWEAKSNEAARVRTRIDEAISEKRDDIIGRDSVVASIVHAVLTDHASAVAVTGAYGDGKSSVLNLVSNVLADRDEVVVIRFSTWFPTDEESLISSILNSVVEKLQTRFFIPKIKTSLVDFTRMLFEVLPRVPTSVKDLFQRPSQAEQFSELEENLSKLPVRVAVLLDDMDRMQRRELDALLKLIRGGPQFPKLTFVCAFYPGALISTLQGDSSVEACRKGEEFLEKFFPLRIPLPKIEPTVLAVEFETKFYNLCDRHHVLMGEEERNKFRDDFRVIWHRYVRGFVTNLRRLNLVISRIDELLPLVSEEINLLDFVLLELVRMMNPVIYEEIFRNAGYFMFARWRTTTWLDIIDVDQESEQKRCNEYFRVLFLDQPRPPEGVLVGLMAELFPTVKAFLGEQTSLPPQSSDTAANERRIYHPDFFARYFILRVPQDLFGQKELREFIASVNAGSNLDECVATVTSKYHDLKHLPMKRWDLLQRVKSSVDAFSPTALVALPIAISQISGELDDPAHALDIISSREIVFASINRIRDDARAQNILEKVIEESVSDRFATDVLNESDPVKHSIRPARSISKDELERVFRNRMTTKYSSEGTFSFFRKQGSTDIVPLGRWALCGPEGRKQVHDYLSTEFHKQHSNIGAFLAHFLPIKNDGVFDPRTQAPMKAIEIYFPLKELAQLIDDFGESAHSSPDGILAVHEFKSRCKEHGLEQQATEKLGRKETPISES